MRKFKTVHGISDNGHRNVKNGTTDKKNRHEFKKMPNDKIALVNGSQAQSNGNPKNQKNGVNCPLQMKSQNGGDKKSVSTRASTSGVKYPEVKTEPEEEIDDNSSCSKSINEEIMIKVEDGEEFDANSNSDDALKNKSMKLFESLKQEIKEEPSSDDAEDVVENIGMKTYERMKQDVKEEPSNSDAENALENKGIKMFESLKQEVKKEASSGNDDSDDDDKEGGESEEDAEDDCTAPGLAALLEPIVVNESNDEDFEATENYSDEDGDENDEDYEDSLPDITVVENEKDNGAKENGAVQESNCKSIKLTKKERIEEEINSKRTVFIGNVPKDSDILAFEKQFGQFGTIKSMRLRDIVPVNPNLLHKIAATRKKNCWEENNVCYLITYENEDSAKKALAMNGKKWNGNILRVDNSHLKKKPDFAKAVFLGNLPYKIKDNELWELFEQCGQINSVRVPRGRETGRARGIGYINFESVDGVALAMQLNGTMIRKRKLRIQPSTPQAVNNRRRDKRELKTSFSGTAGSASPKKIKIEDSEAVEIATHYSVNAVRRKVGKGKKKRLQGEKQRVKWDSRPQGKGKGKYLGQKVDAKKKPKQNKSAKKKKQTVVKVLANLKKPAAKCSSALA